METTTNENAAVSVLSLGQRLGRIRSLYFLKKKLQEENHTVLGHSYTILQFQAVVLRTRRNDPPEIFPCKLSLPFTSIFE